MSHEARAPGPHAFTLTMLSRSHSCLTYSQSSFLSESQCLLHRTRVPGQAWIGSPGDFWSSLLCSFLNPEILWLPSLEDLLSLEELLDLDVLAKQTGKSEPNNALTADRLYKGRLSSASLLPLPIPFLSRMCLSIKQENNSDSPAGRDHLEVM